MAINALYEQIGEYENNEWGGDLFDDVLEIPLIGERKLLNMVGLVGLGNT